MTISPLVGFWFSLVAAIFSGLAVAGTELTSVFGADMAGRILGGLALLNVIINATNAVLHAIPSQSTPAAQKAFLLGPGPK